MFTGSKHRRSVKRTAKIEFLKGGSRHVQILLFNNGDSDYVERVVGPRVQVFIKGRNRMNVARLVLRQDISDDRPKFWPVPASKRLAHVQSTFRTTMVHRWILRGSAGDGELSVGHKSSAKDSAT